jgi:hypothetical protein
MPIFKLLEGGLEYVTNGAEDGWGSMVDPIFLEPHNGYINIKIRKLFKIMKYSIIIT